MLAITSERRFLDTPERFIVPNSLLGYEEQSKIEKSIAVSLHQFNRELHIPIYLYGLLTQLVKVDIEKQEVVAKFTLYATALVNLTEDHVFQLKQTELARIPEHQKQDYLKEEYKKLQRFITDNLILECGDKVIDVINEEPEEENQSEDSEEIQSDEDGEDDDLDDYICRKVKSHSSSSETVTYQIQATLNCDFTLNSLFFPYLSLDCSFMMRARTQYFSDITIRYKMFKFSQEDQYSVRQFSYQFLFPRNELFGIYRVKPIIDSFIVHAKEREMIDFEEKLTYSLTRYLEFRFEVFSYNLPFILRNLVPVLLLCFASLMCYLAGADAIWDVYGNAILLIITLIQLLSNFSSSKFNTSKFNLYQGSLMGVIVINILLIIVGTNNFYNSDPTISNINAKNALFWVSVCIGSLFVLSNTVILTYFGLKTKGYALERKSKDKHYANIWHWNQQMFDNFIDDIDATLRQTIENP